MSTQSSSNGTAAVLQSATQYLYQVGCPILMLIGTMGCILNLIVFTQKNLRKNPCSIYFIAYNITNLLYIYSSLLSLMLDVGYNIDPSSHYLIICRLRLYAAILFNCLSPFYLILASIDRVLVTSSNALTRHRSTRRLAYVCIIGGTLFWTLFHIHALVLTNIIQLGPNVFLCYFSEGVYLAFVGYYSLIKEMLALSLMIIFGVWAIRNIRNAYLARVAPHSSANATTGESCSHTTSSKDRQLILILRIDVTIHALFSFMYAIFLMYQQITQNYIKVPERIRIENSVRNICLFSIGIPFCSSCYANLLVSKTFRNEVKKIFSWL
jgi:hypothetical protein